MYKQVGSHDYIRMIIVCTLPEISLEYNASLREKVSERKRVRGREGGREGGRGREREGEGGEREKKGEGGREKE